MTDQRLVDLSNQLHAISETLTELSVEVLRETVESGGTKRPEIDKKLSKARRAVDKAALLLRPES